MSLFVINYGEFWDVFKYSDHPIKQVDKTEKCW